MLRPEKGSFGNASEMIAINIVKAATPSKSDRIENFDLGIEPDNDKRNRAATLRVDFSLRRIRRSGSRNC